MDITTDFGSVVLGSSPGGRTKLKIETCVSIFFFVRDGSMFLLLPRAKTAESGQRVLRNEMT